MSNNKGKTLKSREAIQSYVMTTAKYDFSVYEKRVLYRIIEALQDMETIKNIKNGVSKVGYRYEMIEEIFGDRVMKFDIDSFFLKGDDKNYDRIKQALRDLNDKKFEYTPNNTDWEIIRLIESPKFKGNGAYTQWVEFRIDKTMFKAFLDFTKGYRLVEIETAMSFNSQYAMRFYELINKQTSPVTYFVEDLKEMFKLQDKYKQTRDFLKRVVDVAKRELDEKSPYSFKYKINRKGRRIESLTIIPIKQDEGKMSQEELQELYPISENFFFWMKISLGMSENEINNNRRLISHAEQEFSNLENFLLDQQEYIHKAENKKGYFIQMLKIKFHER